MCSERTSWIHSAAKDAGREKCNGVELASAIHSWAWNIFVSFQQHVRLAWHVANPAQGERGYNFLLLGSTATPQCKNSPRVFWKALSLGSFPEWFKTFSLLNFKRWSRDCDKHASMFTNIYFCSPLISLVKTLFWTHIEIGNLYAHMCLLYSGGIIKTVPVAMGTCQWCMQILWYVLSHKQS